VNRRKNGRASEAVAASAPTKTCRQRTDRPPRCSQIPSSGRSPDSRVHLVNAGESPSRVLGTQWQSDSLYTRLPLRGSAGLVLEEHAPASRFTSPPFSFRTKRAAKHLTTSGMMLTVAKAISKLRTYPTYYALRDNVGRRCVRSDTFMMKALRYSDAAVGMLQSFHHESIAPHTPTADIIPQEP